MTDFTKSDLGWSAFFQSQIALEEIDSFTAARVSGVHRDRIDLIAEARAPRSSAPPRDTDVTVGDWVLLDAEGRIERVLRRQSLLQRRAAGSDAARQLIAANVGTLGIVTSCNADFNLARLERYLVLASASGCLPLVILTKADLAEDPDAFRRQAEALSPLASAVAINALNQGELDRLSPWCRAGETLALVGSSGVGKTTILNGLTGSGAVTQGIREDDAKGRHTTTARAMLRTRAGGWLIDTPGMRALRIMDAAEGLGAVFGDIEDLARACRFGDCGHDSEPACAVQAAIASGELDPGRLDRWRKLGREDRRNSETVAEARSRDRALHRIYRDGKASRKFRRGD